MISTYTLERSSAHGCPLFRQRKDKRPSRYKGGSGRNERTKNARKSVDRNNMHPYRCHTKHLYSSGMTYTGRLASSLWTPAPHEHFSCGSFQYFLASLLKWLFCRATMGDGKKIRSDRDGMSSFLATANEFNVSFIALKDFIFALTNACDRMCSDAIRPRARLASRCAHLTAYCLR